MCLRKIFEIFLCLRKVLKNLPYVYIIDLGTGKTSGQTPALDNASWTPEIATAKIKRDAQAEVLLVSKKLILLQKSFLSLNQVLLKLKKIPKKETQEFYITLLME